MGLMNIVSTYEWIRIGVGRAHDRIKLELVLWRKDHDGVELDLE